MLDVNSVTIQGGAMTAVQFLVGHAAGHAALRSAGAEAALSRLAPADQGVGGGRFDARRAAAEALAALRGPAPTAPLAAGTSGVPINGAVTRSVTVPTCVACGAAAAPGRQLMMCGACRGPERWCGAACQRASWPAHKSACRQRTAGAP
jgi:hypothetical protein